MALDALMRDHFGQFGNIQDVRVFKDKGFSFIKCVTHYSDSLHLLTSFSYTQA